MLVWQENRLHTDSPCTNTEDLTLTTSCNMIDVSTVQYILVKDPLRPSSSKCVLDLTDH